MTIRKALINFFKNFWFTQPILINKTDSEFPSKTTQKYRYIILLVKKCLGHWVTTGVHTALNFPSWKVIGLILGYMLQNSQWSVDNRIKFWGETDIAKLPKFNFFKNIKHYLKPGIKWIFKTFLV